MQLAQPTQGSHPGETGLSCLEYVLQGHATIPPETGHLPRHVAPDAPRRLPLHLRGAATTGRLGSTPETARHRVLRGPAASLVPAETGVVWVPVEHDGCTQSSDEECDAIVAIVGELLGREVVDKDGGAAAHDAWTTS